MTAKPLRTRAKPLGIWQPPYPARPRQASLLGRRSGFGDGAVGQTAPSPFRRLPAHGLGKDIQRIKVEGLSDADQFQHINPSLPRLV